MTVAPDPLAQGPYWTSGTGSSYLPANATKHRGLRAQRGPLGDPRRLRHGPTDLDPGSSARAFALLYVDGGRPGPPVAVDHLAHTAPRRQRRAAHDRELRPGPQPCRPAVPPGLVAAPRRRSQRGCLRNAPHLPGPRLSGLLRVLPARRVRLRARGAPAGARRLPTVQPRHVAGVGAQRRHPHREEGRPRGGLAQPPAGDPPDDVCRPREAVAGRAASASNEQSSPDLSVGAPVRHLRPPTDAVTAAVQHVLHQPRRVRNAPLLGGPSP